MRFPGDAADRGQCGEAAGATAAANSLTRDYVAPRRRGTLPGTFGGGLSCKSYRVAQLRLQRAVVS